MITNGLLKENRSHNLLSRIKCDTILELGCGFGNRLLQVPSRFRCGVEIFYPYIANSKCRDKVNFVNADMCHSPFKPKSFDVVAFIDALEHLCKRDAIYCLKEAEGLAKEQVIIFCPKGDDPLDYDAWGYGNDYHQTHKSKWYGEELESLGYKVTVLQNYHKKGDRVFDALWACKSILTHPQAPSLKSC